MLWRRRFVATPSLDTDKHGRAGQGRAGQGRAHRMILLGMWYVCVHVCMHGCMHAYIHTLSNSTSTHRAVLSTL